MSYKEIMIEAASLEEARERVKSQIPHGFVLFSEKVISDGKPKTKKDIGETIQAAFAKAQSQIPLDASVLEKRIVAAPERKLIRITSPNEQSAMASVKEREKQQLGDNAIVESIRLITEGKKGFLGIGAKPSEYEAVIIQQAVVELIYETEAKISAEVMDEALASQIRETLARNVNEIRWNTREQRLFYRVGCLLVLIGVCAFGYLALASDWRYWVAVAGLIGGWWLIDQILSKHRHQKLLDVLRAAFAPSSLTVPHLKEGNSYGYPTFKLTFPSEAELKQAEESGSIAVFTQAIQSLYADVGGEQSPFDADRAVSATYEGSSPQSW